VTLVEVVVMLKLVFVLPCTKFHSKVESNVCKILSLQQKCRRVQNITHNVHFLDYTIKLHHFFLPSDSVNHLLASWPEF